MSENVVVPNMKKMLVLGGMGPQATVDFQQRVHKIAQERVPRFVNRGYPPMRVEYHRDAPMELGEDGESIQPLRPDPKLLELARSMGPSGDFMVIPCNTAHLFMQEIEEAAGCKVLSIIDVTIEELKRRGFSSVGLLAVGEALKGKLFQNRFEEAGIQWAIPRDELIAELDEAIWKVMEGEHVSVLHNPLWHVLQPHAFRPREIKLEAVILGCTELPLARGFLENTQWAFPLINPNQLFAEAAVRYALEP